MFKHFLNLTRIDQLKYYIKDFNFAVNLVIFELIVVFVIIRVEIKNL
jgi:hypothetical protein